MASSSVKLSQAVGAWRVGFGDGRGVGGRSGEGIEDGEGMSFTGVRALTEGDVDAVSGGVGGWATEGPKTAASTESA